MAVFEVLTFAVKPGRLEDFLADARELKRTPDRVDVGLTSMRVVRLMIAGPDSGRVALLFENADLSARRVAPRRAGTPAAKAGERAAVPRPPHRRLL